MTHYVYEDEYGNIYGGISIGEIGKRIKGFFTGREGPPPDVRENLSVYGNYRIIRIWVCRVPIYSQIETVANLLSLGLFNKRKKELNYDKLFHLFMVIEAKKGDNIIFLKTERNEVVNLTKIITPKDAGGECEEIYVNKVITVGRLIENAEKSLPAGRFWQYDAFKNNCQDYVMSLLNSSGLGIDKDYQFIKQDVNDLIIGPFDKIARKITDLASRVDILLRGLGKFGYI